MLLFSDKRILLEHFFRNGDDETITDKVKSLSLQCSTPPPPLLSQDMRTILLDSCRNDRAWLVETIFRGRFSLGTIPLELVWAFYLQLPLSLSFFFSKAKDMAKRALNSGAVGVLDSVADFTADRDISTMSKVASL